MATELSSGKMDFIDENGLGFVQYGFQIGNIDGILRDFRGIWIMFSNVFNDFRMIRSQTSNVVPNKEVG
jgi:hypothetical protein